MAVQTSHDEHITTCIDILEPQFLHYPAHNSVFAHSLVEVQLAYQKSS